MGTTRLRACLLNNTGSPQSVLLYPGAAQIPVYFCDPASPWQRGSNENINQYFPKGTDLGVHSPEHLAMVAAELNRRPREILGWQSPMEHLARLASPPTGP